MSINWFTNLPFFSIFLMMFAGIITSPIKSGRVAARVSISAISIVLCFSAALLFYTSTTGDSFTFMMGHFPAPWGNELKAGNLEALMATLFSVVTLMSLLGGKRDIMVDILPEKQNLYFIMLNLLFGAMLALIYTNDIFTAFVFIEISTIAACSLIMAKDTSRSMVATTRYLIMMLLGSGLFLFGIVILYAITGQLLMIDLNRAVVRLAETGRYDMPLRVIVGLIFTGIAVKSALFPFHTMLPGAHSVATTTSSAMLSGLVLKSFIILLVKLVFRVFTVEVLARLGIMDMLFVMAILAMVVCSLMALRESELKRMIAYSSAAQIGYIYLGISLSATGGAVPACFHILAHALCKSMLFLCAGGLINASGHKTDLHSLRGAAYRNPFAGIGFTIGALSMIGLPLMPGFVTKLYLAEAAMGSMGQFVMVVAALIFSMVFNALYFIPATISIWTRVEGERMEKIPLSYSASISVLLALNLLLGVFFQPVLALIERGIAAL